MASLSISFLRPVPVAPCLGQAKVLKIGKRLCFVEGRLTAGGKSLITAQAALANDNP
jgi:acyl-coenzyme A thioesterase PaaI-like protein